MRLIILGAGGFGRTVADIAGQLGRYESIRHLDDHPAEGVVGTLAEFQRFIDGETEMIPAFGNNGFRLEWCRRIKDAGGKLATVVHPDAYVSPTAAIGEGTVVLPKAVVNTACRVGMGCIVNLGALIDHGCTIGDGCHICLGAIVKADNNLPEGLKVEAGQVIENRHFV